MIFPRVIAHADRTCWPRKRQMALATLAFSGANPGAIYKVTSLAPTPGGRTGKDSLFELLHETALPGQTTTPRT